MRGVLNYLGQANGAAECNGHPNVVTHPEVDCMDAASHVDQLMQGFTLMNQRKTRGKFQTKTEQSLRLKTKTRKLAC